MLARIPLVLEPQPEGGYTVTSPLLPELITEGDTIAECLANAEDAFAEEDAMLPDWGSRDRKIGFLRSAIRQLGLDWTEFQES